MKEKIIFAGGCHFCVEAIFKELQGVEDIKSGYYHLNDDFAFETGDKVEAVRFTYDTDILSFDDLLDIFYFVHTPTLVVWEKDLCFFPLCRSAIIYNTAKQKELAEEKIRTITPLYTEPVQTRLIPEEEDSFFLVEEKYQNYYEKEPKDGYCTSIIDPKMEKLRATYQRLLKKQGMLN